MEYRGLLKDRYDASIRTPSPSVQPFASQSRQSSAERSRQPSAERLPQPSVDVKDLEKRLKQLEDNIDSKLKSYIDTHHSGGFRIEKDAQKLVAIEMGQPSTTPVKAFDRIERKVKAELGAAGPLVIPGSERKQSTTDKNKTNSDKGKSHAGSTKRHQRSRKTPA